MHAADSSTGNSCGWWFNPFKPPAHAEQPSQDPLISQLVSRLLRLIYLAGLGLRSSSCALELPTLQLSPLPWHSLSPFRAQGLGSCCHVVDLAYFLSPERVQCFRRHVFSFSLPTLLILFASLAPFSFQGLGLPETLRRPREASSATGVVA